MYGPVPSRRLGRSLGVDLVPYKTCSYDCIYCQLGRTTNKTIELKEYASAIESLSELERKLSSESNPDFISLAGSGEPTLNSKTAYLIGKIKDMTDTPVAVLTNGSLLWLPEVRDAIVGADMVIPSLDAGDNDTFQSINRPHPEITFENMVSGLIEFSGLFEGLLWLEIFLVDGINANADSVSKLAGLADRIRLDRIQLNTVSRPPTETYARAVPIERMHIYADMFNTKAEVICDTARSVKFQSECDAVNEEEISSLLSRRPCTVQDVANGLGLHPAETVKHLHLLNERGLLKTTRRGTAVYYHAQNN